MLKFVSIEGNIGSGKSTLLSLLQSHYQANPNYLFINEPLSDWQCITDPFDKTQTQVNLLEMFYQDPERWGYAFQSYAFFSRLRNYHQIMQQQINGHNGDGEQIKYVVSERSILSDKYVFAENSYRQGFMTEAEKIVYDNWFHFLHQTISNHYSAHVYLQCEPEVSYQRIKKRERSEENSIGLEYIESIYKRHEEWLVDDKESDVKVLTVNGNPDFQDDEQYQQQVMKEVSQFIQNI